MKLKNWLGVLIGRFGAALNCSVRHRLRYAH